jgi:hypothetical protein
MDCTVTLFVPLRQLTPEQLAECRRDAAMFAVRKMKPRMTAQEIATGAARGKATAKLAKARRDAAQHAKQEQTIRTCDDHD